MKHLALTITTTLATLAAILMIWQLRSIVLLCLFSILIASALRSPIDRLIQQGFRRWLAMTLIYGVILLGIVALVGSLLLPITRELDALTHDLTQLYERGYGLVQGGAADSTLFRRLPTAEAVGELLLESQPSALVRRILGITQSFAFFIGQVILSFVLSVYWTADQLHFERLWLSLLPPEQRTRMRELWYRLEQNVGAYIRSEILQSVLAGGLLTLGFGLIGLEYPFCLAAVGAVAWFIPLVGALFAIPLIALIALLNGPLLTVAAVLYTVLVFVFMEFGVEPRLYDRSQQGAILVILIMMAMMDALGIVGLLLAPPLALTFQLILEELLRVPAPVTLTHALTMHELEAQVAQVRTVVGAAETASPRVQNMVERLEQLLQETQEVTA